MTAARSEKKQFSETGSTPDHVQTLPMITEEIVRGRPESPQPTQHVTTPVLPPNPIRREDTVQQPATAGTPLADPAADEPVEKKSEGRISATQLIAGAGAAATSSVIGGQLGVAGTVVGAGVASIITALAVTLYGRSLDKGKEHIKKLAPAVKAQVAKHPNEGAVDRSLAVDSAFAPPATDVAAANPAATSAGVSDSDPGEDTSASGNGPAGWWAKLRRKRVLYPVAIGVAAFGIGLGGVVMAENFTQADISPGTSQISRSVSGNSVSGDSGGSEQSGTDGGSAGADSAGSGSGSRSGADSNQGPANQGTANQGTTAQDGQSTTAGEVNSDGTTTGAQTDQGSATSAGQGSESTAADSSTGSSGTGGSADSGRGSATGSDSASGAGSGAGSGTSGSGSSTGAGSGGGASGGAGASAQG